MAKEKASTSTSSPAPDKHSDIVGGSTAGVRINCPGSYQMERKLPDTVRNKSSSYADEGSACHAAMAYILDNDIIDIDTVEGMVFPPYDAYPMTKKLMKECIVPCVDFFDTLVDESEAEGGLDFIVEKQCELKGIPGAFGTSDLIGRTNVRSVILDWKFGAGKAVYAYYEEPVEFIGEAPGDAVKIIPNEQLLFYATAAMLTYPAMFEADNDDWPIDLYIAQPRLQQSEPNFDKVRVTVKQLKEFRLALIRAIAEAQGSNPTIKRGSWCDFRPCKAICPKFTGPMIDATKLGKALATANEKTMSKTTAVPFDWGALYGDLLRACDLAEANIREVRKHALSFMEGGGKVPDYKLVPKRATEHYQDGVEAKVRKLATDAGVAPDDCWEPRELKSPAQLGEAMEPFMEAKTTKERTDMARAKIAEFTVKTSSGVNIVPADDRRDSLITTGDLTKSLGDKLAALTGR